MWFHDHPLRPVLIGAVVLVFIGLLVVSSRTTHNASGRAINWGGASGIYAPDTTLEQKNNTSFVLEQVAPFRYTPPTSAPSYVETKTGDTETDAYALLLASIRPSSRPLTSAEDSTFLDDVYSLLPQGVQSISTPQELSREQQTLYEYGNEVGSYVDTFESAYGTLSVSILKDFYADRTNATKQNEVRHLGNSIARVGKEIRVMTFVPKGLSGMHTLLAERYQETGELLAAIVDARDNQDLLERINAYNGAADALATAFATLASFFATAHVSFAPHDPGHIFVFSPASSF